MTAKQIGDQPAFAGGEKLVAKVGQLATAGSLCAQIGATSVAMQGLLASDHGEWVAKTSVDLADAVLAELAKEGE